MPVDSDRRPVPGRTAWWSKSLAAALIRAGVKPNHVSLASVGFALIACGLFIVAGSATMPVRVACLIGAAVCVQLRLLCNLLDGMMAVEGGLLSKQGALFNDLPDRPADILFLVGAGYGAQFGSTGLELGWAAATLAVLTAYIRAFGASQGLGQDFCGPMAKPHRMLLLTIAALVAAGEAVFHCAARALVIALVLIVIGSLVTCIRRTVRLAAALEQQP